MLRLDWLLAATRPITLSFLDWITGEAHDRRSHERLQREGMASAERIAGRHYDTEDERIAATERMHGASVGAHAASLEYLKGRDKQYSDDYRFYVQQERARQVQFAKRKGAMMAQFTGKIAGLEGMDMGAFAEMAAMAMAPAIQQRTLKGGGPDPGAIPQPAAAAPVQRAQGHTPTAPPGVMGLGDWAGLVVPFIGPGGEVETAGAESAAGGSPAAWQTQAEEDPYLGWAQ